LSKVSLKQNNKKSLVLASSSPQRLNLLKQIGIIPDKIEPANLAEKILLKEKPQEYVLRISKEKANFVSKRNAQSFIIAGDTIVALGRRILGKPGNKEEAKKFLMMLSGRRHKVLSAVTLITPENKEISKISENIKINKIELITHYNSSYLNKLYNLYFSDSKKNNIPDIVSIEQLIKEDTDIKLINSDN